MSATGPYVDASPAPMLCQRSIGGSIDPTIVRGSGGAEFLLWKNDGNATHVPDGIWAQQLTPDGLGVVGAAHRLLGPDQPWELGIVEAPAMTPASTGGYWLFYSGGAWDSGQYGTGLAYCAAITGPCRETSPRPFLASSATLTSPGGLDTFTDTHGRLWVAFTSLVRVPSDRHPGRYYYNRVLDIAAFVSR
jgi:beta-xylosidase